MSAIDPARLAAVFGAESTGDTPEERAATSNRIYVRSQVQLALDSKQATGRRMNAREALAAFGIDLLEEVAGEGSAGIVSDPQQPADTFSKRRKFLNLTPEAVARAAAVTVEEVEAAETPGSISSIHSLERIGQSLSLNERLLGYKAEALADNKLGARLRDMNLAPGERDDAFIVALADAAWVIGRQAELSHDLGADEGLIGKFGVKSNDYDWPTYGVGYELAEKTRLRLGLSPTEPIKNLRQLIEERIGIPVITAELGEAVAGATIINGKARGIVIGSHIATAPPRRMTLAHELGHLLWDPESKLERVRVDRAGQIGHRQEDPVEIRANAFGIAFLAPKAAVEAIYEKYPDPERTSLELVWQFGISPSAATNHVGATLELNEFKNSSARLRVSPEVYRRWDRLESRPRPISADMPLSRTGRFTELVLRAVSKNLISLDTAGAWLRTSTSVIEKHLRR